MTIVRTIRDILAILACLCVLALTAEVFYVQAKLGAAVAQFQDRTAGDAAILDSSEVTVPDGCDPSAEVC